MTLKSKRLISLDAMRGMTIAFMILVNNPGSWDHVYGPLLHADWHGITPTDFIFPFFLFIVGVSISFAYSKRLEKGASKKDIYKKVLFRGLKIFVLGILLGLFPHFDFGDVRIAGVLQRIAIVFVLCTFIFVNMNTKKQGYLAFGLLIGYWLAMVLIPTPGEGVALLEPGKNLAAWIDQILLPGKMWQGTWDPEGLFSTIPSISTGILGMLAGKVLLSDLEDNEKANKLMFQGLALVMLGLFWHLFFPINKNLWTSSFVLITGGAGYSFLGASYYWVDLKDHVKGTKPWIVFGSNAITAYVLADLLSLPFYGINIGGDTLSGHFISSMMGIGMAANLASMIYAILFVGVNYIPVYWLYKKGIFIKL